MIIKGEPGTLIFILKHILKTILHLPHLNWQSTCKIFFSPVDSNFCISLKVSRALCWMSARAYTTARVNALLLCSSEGARWLYTCFNFTIYRLVQTVCLMQHMENGAKCGSTASLIRRSREAACGWSTRCSQTSAHAALCFQIWYRWIRSTHAIGEQMTARYSGAIS